MGKEQAYFIGLDIGTDSVGYAVTDEEYNIIKLNGEPAWGSHLFDAANQSAERRSFRTARRRLNRRKQRVALIDQIFAPEVTKIDPQFYIRKKESALMMEDKTASESACLYFTGISYNDKSFHKEYPTIHHLIVDLMTKSEKQFDIRLINIAIDWLVAHRGHFLSEVSTDNVNRVLDFGEIYDEFLAFFDNAGIERPWDRIDPESLGKVLKERGINHKKAELKKLLYDNHIEEDSEYILNKKKLVDFLAGGKVKYGELFKKEDLEEEITISISDEMDTLLPQLGEDADLVAKMAAMYDWSVLSDILGSCKSISEAKVRQFEQHNNDLEKLKAFVKNNMSEKYNDVFRKGQEGIANYTAYSYNFNSVQNKNSLPKKKATREEFYQFLKKTLNLDKYSGGDAAFVEDMLSRMDDGTFLPKQVNTDNRVIPYQLYFSELEKILKNAEKHYSFLTDKDEDGLSNSEKIKSVFTFRIPYFVGPLRKDNSKNAWFVRKSEGKIYPWNFESKVDFDSCEDAFINRMTNSCTYIPGEDVLPKCSLLYSKYMVLNEINNLKCNEKPISVEAKQAIYNDLFCKQAKVTPKRIQDYLLQRGFIQRDDMLSGIDITIKSSLKAQFEFRNLLERKVLLPADVDEIVKRNTYTEDRLRYKKWLRNTYPQLGEEDYKYVSRLKYKDFGRLSGAFLNGLVGADKETGECGTIMHFLWESNDNLMQLLSDRYTFMEQIQKARAEYYSIHSLAQTQQLEELGISNAVKRPVLRTLEIIKDIVKATGCAPKKIFVEMARGADQVKKRSVSRKDQILDYYKSVKTETAELEKQLAEMGDTANNQLQSEALFLYYMQLGKCMYSGEAIDLAQIKSTKYNIDHIYPQALVKDDSVINNKVLVLSTENGHKGKDLLDASIRSKMQPYWKHLLDVGLISKEKYARLMRVTPFTEQEKKGFINRQLVETRQSMKAVTQLLSNQYPETEIVYVKAKLSADFRQEFGLPPKSRIINDLHHAKDAYLNIVTGNVYNERFTKKWFNVNQEYSLKTKTLFTQKLSHGDMVIWNAEEDIERVKRIYNKNNIHLTRYTYCQKGGLFDQMPVKKGLGQVEIKKGMAISKYGGYNKPAASFFVIARYLRGGKREVSFVPVELMVKKQFLSDKEFAKPYVQKVLEGINTKKIEEVEFPLGKRIIKIKTVLSLDGFKVWINGKANGGKIVLLTSAESLILSNDDISYVKKIENYMDKKKQNKSFKHDPVNDGLSEKINIELYDTLTKKLESNHFSIMPGNQAGTLIEGRELFANLSFDEQLSTLCKCIDLMKSGRAGGCDLKAINGKNASGVMTLGSNLSSCRYKDVRIIDESASGIYSHASENLLELLS